MKRKGLKILCGVLATLSVLGATSTVVGALSDGFKNWDTSTWFDKGTSEPVTKEDLVTTPDESLPVKMSVSYLGDDTSIKRANSVKPMTGLVITASLDSQYGECNKFVFSFSDNSSDLFDSSITDDSCTITFKKKQTTAFYVFALTTNGSERHRGKLKIDFQRTLKDTISFNSRKESSFFKYNSNSTGRLELDLTNNFNSTARVWLSYQENDGSYSNNISSTTVRISNNNLAINLDNIFLFDSDYYGQIISISSKEICDKISSDPYFKDKTGFNKICTIEITLVTENNIIISGAKDLYVQNYKVIDGGVDMGGDIVVG